MVCSVSEGKKSFLTQLNEICLNFREVYINLCIACDVTCDVSTSGRLDRWSVCSWGREETKVY